MVYRNCQPGEIAAKDKYSAVAYLSSMRTFFAYIAVEDLKCETVNFDTAFLQALVPKGTKVYVE